MNYGLIFWGDSSYNNNIFKILKKTVRIIMGTGTRDSCAKLFKILNILPLQYIQSLMLFLVNNKNKFKINSQIHSINTRNNSNLFQP